MEVWKDIPMYAGIYEVSTLGRVRSKVTGKVSIPIKTESGYLKVAIYLNGRMKSERIHRLVATTFIPNPKNYPQVNHIDEDKTNNRVDNLEWCDSQYNINYGTRTQRAKKAISIAVVCDNITFSSITQCAKYLKIYPYVLSDYLRNRDKCPIDLQKRGLNYADK